MDDWQAWVLEEALAERVDGKWCAFECGLVVPRQNGKGSILEALELAALFLFEMRLIVHSAHEFKTAREHFLRMQSLVQANPDLYDQVDYIHTGAGTESIALKTGARLNFVARSRGSGRGFSGDLIVLDEAFNLPEQAIGAMLPALSARPNPQVWYTSSAPHSDSAVLHGVRKRGISDEPGRLFYAEYGNEADIDWHDPVVRKQAALRANPGMPHRIAEEFVENEYEAMRELGDEFPRERLGIASEPDETSGVFPPGTWAACQDPTSSLVGIPRVGLQVGPGMGWASFATCGQTIEGHVHGELIERHPGTGWVVDAAKAYAAKYGPIIINPSSPTAGILRELVDAGVKVEEVPEAQIPRACARLQEKVIDGTFRHLGQPPLNAAVMGAAIKVAGDTWRWSQTNSRVDITPLVAVTLVLAASEGPKVPHFYA